MKRWFTALLDSVAFFSVWTFVLVAFVFVLQWCLNAVPPSVVYELEMDKHGNVEFVEVKSAQW